MPNRRIRNAILFRQAPLTGKLLRNLTSRDPALNVISDLDVSVLIPKRVNGRSWHTANIGKLPDLL